MARIKLNVLLDPGAFEVHCLLRMPGEDFSRINAYIDTGAQTSLFPSHLLDEIEYTVISEHVIIEQAGIAGQAFEGLEAQVDLMLQDALGNQTGWISIRAWFADTSEALIGFDGVLDRAVLHADLKNGRDAWIEID